MGPVIGYAAGNGWYGGLFADSVRRCPDGVGHVEFGAFDKNPSCMAVTIGVVFIRLAATDYRLEYSEWWDDMPPPAPAWSCPPATRNSR